MHKPAWCCNKQQYWHQCLTYNHWPRNQGPTQSLVSGQTSKDGCAQSQSQDTGVCNSCLTIVPASVHASMGQEEMSEHEVWATSSQNRARVEENDPTWPTNKQPRSSQQSSIYPWGVHKYNIQHNSKPWLCLLVNRPDGSKTRNAWKWYSKGMPCFLQQGCVYISSSSTPSIDLMHKCNTLQRSGAQIVNTLQRSGAQMLQYSA